jgi:hypothetical protein
MQHIRVSLPAKIQHIQIKRARLPGAFSLPAKLRFYAVQGVKQRGKLKLRFQGGNGVHIGPLAAWPNGRGDV